MHNNNMYQIYFFGGIGNIIINYIYIVFNISLRKISTFQTINIPIIPIPISLDLPRYRFKYL